MGSNVGTGVGIERRFGKSPAKGGRKGDAETVLEVCMARGGLQVVCEGWDLGPKIPVRSRDLSPPLRRSAKLSTEQPGYGPCIGPVFYSAPGPTRRGGAAMA